jgi:hypothetical protein
VTRHATASPVSRQTWHKVGAATAILRDHPGFYGVPRGPRGRCDAGREGASTLRRMTRKAPDPMKDELTVLAALTTLVRYDRLEEAVVRATKARSIPMKLHVLELVVVDMPRALGRVAALVSREVLERCGPHSIERLVVTAARHAPDLLPNVLDAVPDDADLVGALFEASVRADDKRMELAILVRVMDLPAPITRVQRMLYRDVLGKAAAVAVRLGEHATSARIAERSLALVEVDDELGELEELEATESSATRLRPEELAQLEATVRRA